MVDVPHLSIPLRLAPGGRLAVMEQDSGDDVAQCVGVLLDTIEGSRVEVPEYGIPDPTFGPGVDTTSMQVAIDEWEPRAAVDLDEVLYGVDGDESRVQILAAVRLSTEVGED